MSQRPKGIGLNC